MPSSSCVDWFDSEFLVHHLQSFESAVVTLYYFHVNGQYVRMGASYTISILSQGKFSLIIFTAYESVSFFLVYRSTESNEYFQKNICRDTGLG
jgi:hypothetical protein